jgi:DNA-nicking Smr family endonuclease
MAKKRSGDADDLEIFRQQMQDVRPLKDSGRTVPDAPRPRPRASQRARDEREVMKEILHFPEDPSEMETGEELSYLRPGLQHRYLTRLKRGQYSIADSIDLHRMNAETARTAILEFIDYAHDRGLGCVRIVHGKGLRSKKGPVLKLLTRRLLASHPRVAAFASCRPVDGGTGAVSVLLRKGGKKPV